MNILSQSVLKKVLALVNVVAALIGIVLLAIIRIIFSARANDHEIENEIKPYMDVNGEICYDGSEARIHGDTQI